MLVEPQRRIRASSRYIWCADPDIITLTRTGRRRGQRRLVGGQLRILLKKSKCLSLRAWASVYRGNCPTVFLGACATVYFGDCVTVWPGDCAIVSLEFVPLCLWSLCYRDSGSLRYCDSGTFCY